MPIPTISVSRLQKAACERKYVGHYLLGLKEEQGAGAQFGTEFHAACEAYQLTGDMGVSPESTIGKLLRAGAHFLKLPKSTNMLIEAEHRGTLPDGTPWMAYLDASDAWVNPLTATLCVDDQKTTSDAARALTSQTLPEDLQGGFYSWIMFQPHEYRLTEESPWLEWDPAGIKSVRLNWNYFLTRGSPRAWNVPAFISRQQADRHLDTRIMPLVERVKAIHAAFDADKLSLLNDFARNMGACGGVGTWCGASAQCDMNRAGTSVLVQLTTKPKQENTDMGLAELKAKYGQKPTTTPAASPKAESTETVASSQPSESVAAPAAEEPASATAAPETSPPVTESAASAPSARPRTRRAPPVAPPAPEGDTINPPEAKSALAELQVEPKAFNSDVRGTPATDELMLSIIAVGKLLPVGASVTITGVRA
jgi:hypothetical protein